MGWVMLIGLAVLAGLLLWAIGFPRRLWTIPATALTLGAAGYAWQGSPDVAGTSVAQKEERVEIDPEIVALRDALFGRFNFAWTHFMRSDAMTRIGARSTAVRAMLLAVQQGPRDPAVWTGLGMAFADHDGGLVSPASRFAFDRAMAVHPTHPGPPFFLGLAYVRAGQLAEARTYWARAVELAPAEASYREALVMQLERLDRVIAMQAGQVQAP